MSTHSPNQPFSCGDKVLLLKEGRIIGFGTPQTVLTSTTLKKVYNIDMDILTVADRYGNKRTLCLPVSN